MNQLILNRIVTDKVIQDFKDSLTCTVLGPISTEMAMEIMKYKIKMSMLLALYGECRPSLN